MISFIFFLSCFVFFVSFFHSLSLCYRKRAEYYDPACLVKSPHPPETRKYTKKILKKYGIPHPGSGPKKNEKKYRKNTENGPKMTFSVFVRYFFRSFGARPWVGDAVFFSEFYFFRVSGGLGLFTRQVGSEAEYCFGEYGFKHGAHWVFLGSLSSRERTQ